MKSQTLIAVLAVIMALSAWGFAFSDATDDFKLTKELFKPLIIGIQAVPAQAKVEGWSLAGGYNTFTMRYDNITATVHNTGPDVSVNVDVELFNVNRTTIAWGEKQVNLFSNSTFHVNIPLQWIEDKTILDYAGGLVTIS